IRGATGSGTTAATVAVACSDGLVRLFDAETLAYSVTLPRPQPLGPRGANVASVKELQEITEASTVAGGRATLGCRLSPSGTKVVCVYADRSVFIWDVTNRGRVGKYRSFVGHGGSIWDVKRVPREWGLGARG
ncbi:unnamed protein product, partial [Discosporangium mesarthrocarpum]